MTIHGGTEHERRMLADDLLLLLAEHGISLDNLREWDGDKE